MSEANPPPDPPPAEGARPSTFSPPLPHVDPSDHSTATAQESTISPVLDDTTDTTETTDGPAKSEGRGGDSERVEEVAVSAESTPPIPSSDPAPVEDMVSEDPGQGEADEGVQEEVGEVRAITSEQQHQPQPEGDGTFEDVNLSRSPSATPQEPPVEQSLPADETTPPSEPVSSSDPNPVTPTPIAAAESTPIQPTASTTTSHSATPSLPSLSSPKPESQPSHRRESQASITTVSAPGSTHLVSGILIVSSLESIAATKEAKKSKPLKDALDSALDVLKNGTASTPAGSTTATVDPHLVFLPLRLACETKSLSLMITALDCIGKLVSYDFFVEDKSALDRPMMPDSGMRDDDNESTTGGGGGGPAVNIDQLPLADQITSTVCDCFSPSPAGTAAATSTSSSSSSTASQPTTQHDNLLLRLLSCLLSLILSSSLPVHQSALLKAVRTVYNVFLLGRAGTVQTVAQATLGQIVGGVFNRVKLGEVLPKEVIAENVGLGVEGVNSFAKNNASRTDLQSVKEEEQNEKEGVETENETIETGETVEKTTEEVQKEKVGNEDAEKGEDEEKSETPKIAVSEEVEEKPRLSVGEKITS